MADPQPPGWVAIAGALTAVYAATLSTVQLIRYFKDERPRIKVTFRLGRILNMPGDKKEKLFLTYVNVGKIPLTIASLPALRIHTMEAGTKLVLHSSKYPLPYRLETYAENESWANLENLSEYIDWDRMKKGAEYWITGVVSDASGKNHQSVPYVLSSPKRPESEIQLGATNPANESSPPDVVALPATLSLLPATRLNRLQLRIGWVPRVRWPPRSSQGTHTL
jgi:hypothetical protein